MELGKDITGTENFYEAGAGPGPLGCVFNDKTNDLLWTYPTPHSPDKCVKDSGCCALEDDAKCKTGFTRSFTDAVLMKGSKVECGTSGDKTKYKYTCREATVSATRNSQHNKHGSTAVRPVCKRERTCGRVVLRGKGDTDGNKAYVFNFGGGTNGESSIARATLSHPTAAYKLMKTKTECSDVGEEKLGGVGISVSKCAELCKKQNGCTVFITRNTQGGICFYEKTHKPHECSNQVASTYDMYALTGDTQSGITNLAVQASDINYEMNNCNSETSLSFWARVDTYGNAAMGKGGKVGENTLLQWKDPNPIKWVHTAWFGSTSGSVPMKITKVEANRGYKHEVYCWPPNLEENPDKKEFKDTGTCYRKMPDSYLNTAPYNEVRTNPLDAPQLSCHKPNVGGIGEPLFDSCISGVCRQLQPASKTWRCAGCSNDKDCAKRTYIGKNCNEPGLSVVVRRSDDFYYGGRVMEFDGPDKNGRGAPNNGKINVKMGSVSGEHAVVRSDVYYCKTDLVDLVDLGGSGCTSSSPCDRCEGDCDSDADCAGAMKCYQRDDSSQVPGCKKGGSGDRSGFDYCYETPFSYTYKSKQLPTSCSTSCVIGSIQCPLEQPTSPGLEPDACWDGSHKKANRGVCVFEEHQKSYSPLVLTDAAIAVDRWGPRKYFCSEPGYPGAWCKKNSHCGNYPNSACVLGRCSYPIKDYHQCNLDSQCENNRCTLWWGSTKKCRPVDGWKDYEPCVADNHCKNSKCYLISTFGTGACFDRALIVL
jgi:hypothetical protein